MSEPRKSYTYWEREPGGTSFRNPASGSVITDDLMAHLPELERRFLWVALTGFRSFEDITAIEPFHRPPGRIKAGSRLEGVR